MENSVITLTFGDVGENHKGMQMIGNMVDKGKGFKLKNLNNIKKRFEKYNCIVDLYCLNDELEKILSKEDFDNIDKAYVLVIRNGIQNVFNNYNELMNEQLNLDYDKKAFMYGKVVNKKARHNLCYSDFIQNSDIENKNFEKKSTPVNKPSNAKFIGFEYYTATQSWNIQPVEAYIPLYSSMADTSLLSVFLDMNTPPPESNA